MSDHRSGGRYALWVAAAFFLLFVGNVLLGKLAAMQGSLHGWQAGNVVEALFLFFAVIAFVIAAIQRESRDADESDRRGANETSSVGGNDG